MSAKSRAAALSNSARSCVRRVLPGRASARPGSRRGKVWWRVHGQVDQDPGVSAADDHPAERAAVMDPLGSPAVLAGCGLQASRAAETWPRSGVVKKSRSSVGRAVRCCASRAAPPASRKPLLAGSAKNTLATSSWKAGVYPMRYRIRSDTDAGWRPWARSSYRAPRRDAHSSAPPVPGGAARNIARFSRPGTTPRL